MTPEQQAKSMLEGHGPTLEKIVNHWRLTLGGDPASNKGEYSAVGPDPVRLAEHALAWLGKGKGIVREEPPTVSGKTQHGAAPVVPSLPESPSEPEVIERVVHQDKPETLAKLAALADELAATKARLDARIASPEAPIPDSLKDLIDWTAPPKERQEALLAKWREINGLIKLAEDRGGRATPEQYHKRDRIESGIHFNRPTSAETI